MKRCGLFLIFSLICAVFILGCQPGKAKEFKAVPLSENEVDPEVWGKVYPIHYEMYKQSQEPTSAGKSKYKRGWDTDKVIYDKLSEYPFMALLYNGWGFGIEYNEPRAHFYRVIDQLEIDPSRLKPGGVCLTCKTTYAPELEAKYGLAYYNKPYKEVWSWIPEKHRKLGDSCLDCHNPKDASLHIRRGFTLVKALQTMGVDVSSISHGQMRSIICAQCHVTYVVPRDHEMKPTGLFFPWQGSKLGGISIENIIKVLKSDPAYGEWKQAVTGFKLAYIRHPEFEFFSNNSVHWNAGVSCADCHMPYKKAGGFKVSEHRIMSPLKSDMKACQQCHGETPEWLKQQVIAIQDRTISLLLRAGYQTATAAKLFEVANKAQQEGKQIEQPLYNKAKDLYLEALYRVIFIGAENSIGFHNPTEAERVLADAVAYASKSEAVLRIMLAKAGVQVPVNIELELKKYLNNRGEKKLNFKPEQEFKDPFGTQQNIEAMLR
uniref:nitrite reductase (cytochrome; ammonia-forming) n=1 Tax=Thermodesulfovibrio aggregans TaxID=86166 RepID=A0A7C4EPV9_9BACT